MRFIHDTDRSYQDAVLLDNHDYQGTRGVVFYDVLVVSTCVSCETTNDVTYMQINNYLLDIVRRWTLAARATNIAKDAIRRLYNVSTRNS